MARVGASSQGQSRLRILRIVRRGDRDDPRDLTLSVRFEGDFDEAFRGGRPDGLIPGETLKNLVYQVARDDAAAEIETVGLALSRRVLDAQPRITRVRVDISEQPWTRMDAGGKACGQAFVVGGRERRTAAVTSNGSQTAVVGGLDGLLLMRTSGFLPGQAARRRDDGTDDAIEPLLVGDLSARWTYSRADVTFGPYREGLRSAILQTFAMPAARSVQHTLYAVADVILATHDEILDVTLALYQQPYRPVDLLRADDEDADDLFLAAAEPLAVVEVTVERDPHGRS